ncbi:MAG TPA: alginate export family protein [Methylophilaceae bacterium]|nr:alginate export family protein [Methylophilaceae bacterium]
MSRYKTTSRLLAALAVCTLAVPALAADQPAADQPAAPGSLMEAITAGKPMTNFRLRYEHVDDDVPAHTENADAWTLRSLIGWQTAPFHDFSVAAQIINVAQFNDDFYDTSNGVFGRSAAVPSDKTRFPAVADPDDTDINQLFVEWTGLRNTKLRLGRQSVKLDNVRFIGNIEFRQVMQVFDGVALENKNLLPDTSIYLAHFEGLKQINTQYRQADVEIANVKYSISPSEAIVGYAYLLDMQDGTAAFRGSNSAKTFGLRADGTHIINPDWKVLYTAEYAKQDDYKDGNDNIDSHYLKLGGGAMYGTWYARIDHEILSSNDGLSAFQTPLGTNHLFQGWVDQFLVTPNAGIKDTFASFGGKVFGVALSGEYHIFKSDEDFTTPSGVGTGDKYGTELDLAAAYTYQKWMGKVEYGRFREDDELGATLAATTRKRDTEKLWLTVMYTF